MIRPATVPDVGRMAALVNGYAELGIMLRREPEEIALTIDDYIVAVDGRGDLLACGALREYSPSLGEISAVAVSPDRHGHGVGREIVSAVERLAHRRGIAEVFALTLAPQFFANLGYRIVERSRYPEKVRRDCVGCARRFGCAEVCMQRMLEAVSLEVAA